MKVSLEFKLERKTFILGVCTYTSISITNGANRVQNQPVPLRDLEAFWQYILGYHNFEANFKAWLRGEVKNNQCQ